MATPPIHPEPGADPGADPRAEPEAAPGSAPAREPARTQARGRRPQTTSRKWNAGTWAVLAAGVVLVLLAGAGIVVAGAEARAHGTGDAVKVAEKFVASASTAEDDAWRDLSSNRMRNSTLDRSPLRLDEATMQALDVTMSASAGEPRFVRSAQVDETVDEQQADTAFVMIDLKYSYTTFGSDFTFAIPQQLWLTRPFYYGNDTPDRADADRTPTAIGPWRATALSSPQASGANPGMGQTPAKTTLKTTERGGGTTCSSVGGVFAQLSNAARTNGELKSDCWLREDGSSVIGDDVNLDLLAKEFPLFDASHVPESSFKLRTPLEGNPLLAQYPISTSDGDYIVTLGAASVGGAMITFDDYHLRILGIQKEVAR